MQTASTLRFAYLVSQFPAVNHTYILREIRSLRGLGLDLYVASVSGPDRAAGPPGADELDEISRTFYVKRQGALGAARAHLATLCSRPAGYLRGLVYPLIAGRGDWRKTLAWFFYFVEAVIVGHWMARNGLRHLHVHFSSSVGLIVQRIFPVTLSVTVHGFGELHDDPVGFRLKDKIAACLFLRSISRYGRSQLMRLCPHEVWEKIEVTPLGIAPAAFSPRPFRPDPSPFQILCVGRLSAEKAQHVLIVAVARLAVQGRDVLLRLVGDGPDRGTLARHVDALGLSERVCFEGWASQDRLRSMYESADVFVLPSFVEGIPVVLMEAMAMEIPCVATHITGVPELIRNGVDGLLVSPSDDEELAQAIGTLMDDAGLRRRLGEAGRQRVLRDYDLARNSRRLAEIFRSRLGAERKPAAQPQRSAGAAVGRGGD